jgi:hypothetical protein
LRKNTKERFSEGASGAFLFFSADQKYIIKSMTKEECQVLLRILPSYHEYVIAHPTTFLTKYVGCHSVSLQYTGKVLKLKKGQVRTRNTHRQVHKVQKYIHVL